MLKWLSRLGWILLIIVLIGSFITYQRVKDRFPNYEVDLNIQASEARALKLGFAALPITPEVPDTWTDANGDGRYLPEDGDYFEDLNENGKFDKVWISGFQHNRPAAGVHDQLWARTMIVDDGHTRLALVALDCIGLGSDEVIRIRQTINENAQVDYTIICSSHTHEGPDVIGLWGETAFKSGLDKAYMQYLVDQSAQSVHQAVNRLRPAKLRFAQDEKGAAHLVEDSRKPHVMDPGIRLMQAIDAEADTTLGTLVQWANHPETLWNKNLLLSSDFPHYVREGIEKGVVEGDSAFAQGVGGIAVYVNGAIGGLMTTSPRMGIPSLLGDTTYFAPSYSKIKAQGDHLALLSLKALEEYEEIQTGSISLRAKTIHLPMTNPLYRLAAFLGIFERGFSGWMQIRSEVCIWQLGPASFLHQPGEIYPEIVNGGIETPSGQDFGISQIETPAIRKLMPGTYRFTVGLSNDMIGYIIPKSQWDQSAPFTYDYEEAPYGEVNSVGSETAPILYKAISEIIREQKEAN